MMIQANIPMEEKKRMHISELVKQEAYDRICHHAQNMNYDVQALEHSIHLQALGNPPPILQDTISSINQVNKKINQTQRLKRQTSSDLTIIVPRNNTSQTQISPVKIGKNRSPLTNDKTNFVKLPFGV